MKTYAQHIKITLDAPSSWLDREGTKQHIVSCQIIETRKVWSGHLVVRAA